ncbi:transglutaminase family protein [Spirulina subsalsa FACHB-351]|uniref:Transglutaminase family protein n=1 Tax=Spirulina subsalsa FACHB-351 TaxID=234711 RepID=A0ABT3L4N5_9CYAN|nr:transglutaminase family protein [Spirulina subsalsa]MCW6036463.1 transglutaminase family protein [Spirulina subsalsa FACHB-351]
MIPDSSTSFVTQQALNGRTIRPIAAATIYGIAFRGNSLYALDATSGYLLEVDPYTNNTRILNSHCWQDFVGATGLAISGDTLWFTRNEDVYFCSLNEKLAPHLFISLYYPADGIGVLGSTIYLTCQKSGYILIYSRETRREITRFYAPGIGIENITVRGEELWICDDLEQTVYCLDRATGEVKFSVLTPFENPTGLAFYQDPETQQETLYVAYSHNEPYLRDNPNAQPNHELQYRDRTFLHPLYFHYQEGDHYALSNGYLVEMSYVEELSPLDPIDLQEIEWQIALPAETPRQKLRKIEPVGLPFEERQVDGQRIAVFKFDHLTSDQRYIFGWKATLEVWGIKYQFDPTDGEDVPELPPVYEARYLVDNDNLAMDKENIQRAARDAVGEETNLLRKMYNIRNYVYDRLAYGIKPHIDTPDVALARGVGSCGEYLGVLLALSRLNGIACRTVGRYKCPAKPLERFVPLEPDFNHVWMEFYLPGFGWLPMESNPDDINEGGPYPTRFFMGLAWYHAEMAKGVPFEKIYSKDGLPIPKEQAAIGELAINHVCFTILEELSPGNSDQLTINN